MAIKDKVHFTYRTTCTATGRYYVGLHSTTNPTDGYLGSGTQITYSIKKYGKEAHRLEALQYFKDRAALKLGEKALITEELLLDPMCMNIAPGGGGGRLPGFNHSAATRLKIGERNRARDASVNEKISATLSGRKSPEHSERQLKRFSDVRNHPRTKTFLLQSPAGEKFTFSGVDAVAIFCKQKALSLGVLLRNIGAPVPLTPKLKTVGKNTVGWQVGEQS